jgi:GNAT superfamily N-acetyltransferase
MLDVKPLSRDRLADLERLFGDRSAGSCWCMWYIIAVKEFHQGGEPANAGKFRALADGSALPLGVLAHLDGEPVGWAAAGPRSRYARAVRTLTLKGVDHSEDDDVWLAPCFFVRRDKRGHGAARRLLEGPVELARASGAAVIEGFPFAGSKLGSGDRQVGTEAQFAACGFRAVGHPSPSRVIMRLDLAAP